jgi:hypothetical protein
MMKHSDFTELTGQLESVRKMLTGFHRRLKLSAGAARREGQPAMGKE